MMSDLYHALQDNLIPSVSLLFNWKKFSGSTSKIQVIVESFHTAGHLESICNSETMFLYQNKLPSSIHVHNESYYVHFDFERAREPEEL